MLDSRRNVALACALSALAGYVDGIGFLHLGGLFVSFMSGNSTRMGVSLAGGHWQNAAEALGLIAAFVIGAAAGSLIVLGRGAHRQPWLLLAEAVLLAAGALCYAFGLPSAAIAADRAGDGTGKRRVPDRRRRRPRPHLRHRRAGQGRTTRRGGDDRRRRWAWRPICCCGRRWWRVRRVARSPITGSILPRSGLPRRRHWL